MSFPVPGNIYERVRRSPALRLRTACYLVTRSSCPHLARLADGPINEGCCVAASGGGYYRNRSATSVQGLNTRIGVFGLLVSKDNIKCSSNDCRVLRIAHAAKSPCFECDSSPSATNLIPENYCAAIFVAEARLRDNWFMNTAYTWSLTHGHQGHCAPNKGCAPAAPTT
jgi:hypothetical protein